MTTSINSTRSLPFHGIEREANATADRLLGLPFCMGARGPLRYDCFGLLLELFAACGIPLADPFSGSSVDSGSFKMFRSAFRLLGPGETVQCLDVIKQRRDRSHVVVALTDGYVADVLDSVYRNQLESSLCFSTGIWRHHCLAA